MLYKLNGEETFKSQNITLMKIDNKDIEPEIFFKVISWEKQYKKTTSEVSNAIIKQNSQLIRNAAREVVKMPLYRKVEVVLLSCVVGPKGKVAMFVPRLIKTPECDELNFLPYFDSLKDLRKFEERLPEFKQVYRKITLKPYLMKTQRKELDSNAFTEFLMRKYLDEYGLDTERIKTLAAIIDKEPSSIEDYLKLLKERIESHKKNNASEIGIIGKYNKGLFCNICYVYACNVHTSRVGGKEVKSSLDLENYEWPRVNIFLGKRSAEAKSFLKNRLLVSHRSKKSAKNFKCVNEEYCYRNKITNTNTLTEAQLHLLLELLKLNVPNPCFLAYLINDSNKCNAINEYLNENAYLLRDRNYANIKTIKEEVKPLYTTQYFYHKTPGGSEYIPCGHKTMCNSTETCSCAKSRGHCEKFCICKDYCPRLFIGCNCIEGSECNRRSCKCFVNNRECDPDLCVCCSKLTLEDMKKDNKQCSNMDITLNRKKRIVVGTSTICNGYGMYAAEDIGKDEFICEYLGELIGSEEGKRRTLMNSVMGMTYLFDFTENKLVDALTVGSKMRYANHASHGMENSFAKIIYVNGISRIGLFALKQIKKGSEIFFDYRLRNEMDWQKKYDLTRRLSEKSIE